MRTDSALHEDSYQREIKGAVGEGGHEERVWERHSVGNGMLEWHAKTWYPDELEVFDSGLLLLRLNHAQNRLLVVWWP